MAVSDAMLDLPVVIGAFYRIMSSARVSCSDHVEKLDWVLFSLDIVVRKIVVWFITHRHVLHVS
jgi:hypothetical protein